MSHSANMGKIDLTPPNMGTVLLNQSNVEHSADINTLKH